MQGGCEAYYAHRDTPGVSSDLLPPPLPELDVLDNPDVQQDFVRIDGKLKQADLSLQGISCAACSWLIENRLRQVPGVASAGVNLSNHRLTVRFDEQLVPLSRIVGTVQDIGYRAHPYVAREHEARLKDESRALLRRLAVSGLGAMQAMMFATGLYIGLFQGIAVEFRDFLRFVSFIVATPVVFYAGWPFYVSAWRAIRNRHLNMDVPVTIALLGSYSASVYAMLTGGGETYFDSVSMFIFFVTSSRYLEMRARHKSGEIAGNLQYSQPRIALKWQDGEWSRIATEKLAEGDRILVRPGETFPCDGRIHSGRSTVSEALLTGESLPIGKKEGDPVIGGTQNLEQPLEVLVTATGNQTVMAALQQLLARALSEKPPQAREADRLASLFVGRILVVAVVVFGIWYFIDQAQAFWITMAVLVATCPCALSLATPAALTTATNTLARNGLLVTRGHVLETLAKVTHVVFDKTGTLTKGRLVIESVITHGMTEQQALGIARSLEASSIHPIARAFHEVTSPALEVSDLEAHPGEGVAGTVGGQYYRLGRPDFASGSDCQPPGSDALVVWILLADATGKAVAWFSLRDEVREDARRVISGLRELGIKSLILSGDTASAASALGKELSIDEACGGLSAADKHRRVQDLQAAGACVMMIGDGVNDAPVLAVADLSVAMGSGTDLAQTSADTVLLNDKLATLLSARMIAGRTATIIRQNLRWAFFYNLAVLPPAAMGLVPPYLAALGMSLSSLVVVSNALRLRKD